ncbi:MAG: polysaccharide deacetylase family protein [Phycisphaerales bacterium]|nr:polysaccharide deacetylase family protein [Phycisphaerales bacterium]
MSNSWPANILTFDVEDWYQLVGDQVLGAGKLHSDVLAAQIDRLLGLLARRAARATFFCLGKSLAHRPDLVRRIADAGHEIASHGWSHELVHSAGLSAFAEDLRRSLGWLAEVTGRAVLGYRAPAFSVPADQLEAFYDVCMDSGLRYDSSVFPIRGRRYGVPGAPPAPHVARERGGQRLIELPLATLEWRGRRWPVAGGGYWRVSPLRLLDHVVRRINRESRPVVTYFHPYEFDAHRLSATRAAGWSMETVKRSLTQNLGRASMYRKLDAMLLRYRFVAAEDHLHAHGLL